MSDEWVSVVEQKVRHLPRTGLIQAEDYHHDIMRLIALVLEKGDRIRQLEEALEDLLSAVDDLARAEAIERRDGPYADPYESADRAWDRLDAVREEAARVLRVSND